MTIESATYLADLNSAYPDGANQKKEGDNHIRLIKSVLLETFKGFSGCTLLTGTDAGTVNNYAINPTNALAAYGTDMMVLLIPANTNTTGSTLNISSLGTKTIKDVAGNALVSGDLVAGSAYLLFYDGTDFLIVTGPTKNYVDQLSFSSSLPAQTGNSGKYLTTDGATASWNDVLASPALTGTPTSTTAAVDTNTTQIATTAFVIAQAYAKLAGPTFTGNVTVPTLAADATTGYAINAAWYNGQIGTAAPLINGTAAAGTSKRWTPIDHVHPTDTSRAPVASPTFTGTPAAPTASPGTNSTQIATTAYADAAAAAVSLPAASQAEMEAASSNTVSATPGNINWHPGVAKLWLLVTVSGGIPSVAVSHNVTSITDVSAGVMDVTIATDFSSANYVVNVTGYPSTTTNFWGNGVTLMTVGSFRVNNLEGDEATAPTGTDPFRYLISAFGDQ